MPDSQLQISLCPTCLTPLFVLDIDTSVACPACRMVYPIRDHIPFLFQEAAIPAGIWIMGDGRARREQQ